ncbi:Serine/arginine-rich splicing factor 5 [Tupaia chinensis]|uniref:Serine/arginine-rich splicing factor 5 n=1 Tax=Tupaia chinensis TaxID=246437 RepID=L8XZT6_TUPCH|nr:Serine/arginine-rich splicing factor 5 [Tupaia chinensis]
MSGCRVFIGRLNPAAREKDVERFFKGYGRIRDIDLKRGFGFVSKVLQSVKEQESEPEPESEPEQVPICQ